MLEKAMSGMATALEIEECLHAWWTLDFQHIYCSIVVTLQNLAKNTTTPREEKETQVIFMYETCEENNVSWRVATASRDVICNVSGEQKVMDVPYAGAKRVVDPIPRM